MGEVGLAGDGAFVRANAFSEAIAASAGRIAVDFQQPSDIDIRAKRTFHSLQVGTMAIGRQLHARGKPVGHILYKSVRIGRAAVTD